MQDHQGGHVHMCSGPPLKQELGKVPTPAHMGSPITSITNTTMQASQPTIQHHFQLTSPLLVPPSTFSTAHYLPPSANTTAGGAPILFPYGKYTCLS